MRKTEEQTREDQPPFSGFVQSYLNGCNQSSTYVSLIIPEHLAESDCLVPLLSKEIVNDKEMLGAPCLYK